MKKPSKSIKTRYLTALLLIPLAFNSCGTDRDIQAAHETKQAEPALVPKPVSFFATDGLEVSADLYLEHPAGAPFIVLYHMAKSGSHEYKNIVGRLAKLGFNSLAVDQRSGGNETSARAGTLNLSRSYKDALPDMVAALAFVKREYAEGKIVLMGSSYSAALALKMAGDAPDCCDSVLAFSPAEYFGEQDYITRSAKKITVPVFISSTKYEGDDWAGIFAAIPGTAKASFLPQASGAHGSPAVLPETPGSGEYWSAVVKFLQAAKVLE